MSSQQATVRYGSQMTGPLSRLVLGCSLSSFLAISYILCVLYGLFVSD
jgi:hypothetical protein